MELPVAMVPVALMVVFREMLSTDVNSNALFVCDFTCNKEQYVPKIDLIHKSHNATVPYPTMPIQNMCMGYALVITSGVSCGMYSLTDQCANLDVV